MKIASLFQEKKTVLSFEIFPPKKTNSVEIINSTLDGLKE